MRPPGEQHAVARSHPVLHGGPAPGRDARNRGSAAREGGTAFGAARARELALTGGEDYELAFTAPAGTVQPTAEEFEARFALSLTRVGEVTSGAGLDIVGTGAAKTPSGFDHFKAGS